MQKKNLSIMDSTLKTLSLLWLHQLIRSQMAMVIITAKIEVEAEGTLIIEEEEVAEA